MAEAVARTQEGAGELLGANLSGPLAMGTTVDLALSEMGSHERSFIGKW